MRTLLIAFATAVLLSGCMGHVPVNVSGNGACHPSADLASHKVMKKAPEAETPLEDLWALFAKERKDHATDIRDYNSLYNTCVGGQQNASSRGSTVSNSKGRAWYRRLW